MADTTTSQGEVPTSLQPYVSANLTNAANVFNPNLNPYAGLGSYYGATGQTPFAQFNPLQQQAAKEAESMGSSEYLDQAAGIAGLAAQQGMNASYTPTAGANFYTPYAGQITAPSLQNYQMGPVDRIGTSAFGQQSAQDYMSPYISNVLERQKQGAVGDYARALPGMGASASRAGGLRGSRNALVQAESQRNLGNRLDDITATGLNAAYNNAQQQFNQDQTRALQAQQSNQQMGYNVGNQNLQALLNTQQLGANQNFQTQQANQNAGLQNAQLGAQYGLSGANLAEQSRQFGANYGMQGMQRALDASSQLGALGQNKFNQNFQANQNRQTVGQNVFNTESDVAKARFADYQAMMNDPMNKVKFMSGILSQVPVSNRQTTPGSDSTADWMSGIGSILAAYFGGKK